jgi:hypothetical protein
LQTNSILQYRRSLARLLAQLLSPRGQTLIKTHINQYGNGAVHPPGEISLHPSLGPSFMSDTAKSITVTEAHFVQNVLPFVSSNGMHSTYISCYSR